MDKRREAHWKGILKLIAPEEVARARNQFARDNGREKFLKRLAHQIEMHPAFTSEPPRGSRDTDGLVKILEALGAPKDCYVVASDTGPENSAHPLDDSIQPLRALLDVAHCEFAHGTIMSCIPGRLALFRTAFPHRNLIVHRPIGQ